jgi:hypothetical protein
MENGNQPATRRDIEQLRSEFRQDIEQLRSEFQHGFDELKETMRDGQTELLKAFYNYSETTDLKLRDGQSSDASLRDRMSVLERRVTEVEKRLNTPPAA